MRLLVAFGGSALTYIDPASASYVIQIIAAVCAAGGAVIAICWKKCGYSSASASLTLNAQPSCERARIERRRSNGE